MNRAPAFHSGRLGIPNLEGMSQTNDFKSDTWHFLAWRSALLGYGKNWLAQC